MAMRKNVFRKRREIRRELAPLENYLLDDIAEGTIYLWRTTNEFDLKDLADSLNTGVNRVYMMINKLQKLGIITKEATRYLGRFVLGLNSEYFGQILIDHQNELEKKRHLKIVVDNSDNDVDNFQDQVPNGTKEVPNGTREVPNRESPCPKRDLENQNSPEIIEENRPIDSFRLNIDPLRVKNRQEDAHAFPWEQESSNEEKARLIREMIGGSLKRI